jgi:uncharacterized protein YecE (DUF72 family)
MTDHVSSQAPSGRRPGSSDGIIRVGTCAWGDHEDFYPPGLKPTDRISYYARRYPVVEVNASYYHLLPQRNYAGWAAKTPDDFTFNVKAYGQLTQHDRDEPPTAEAFAAFRESYLPLVEASKLGAVLFQFPPWFTNEPRQRTFLGRVAREMEGDQVVVEFRHTSWLIPDHAPKTLALLNELNLGYVIVDAPQVGDGTAPLVPAVTDPDIAYIRLHGRNTHTWYRKVKTTGERFDYLYSAQELEELVPRVRELAHRATEVHVMFNNNRRNYATVNAEQMMRLLGQLDRPPESDQGVQLPLIDQPESAE